jgi:hypothetical protein
MRPAHHHARERTRRQIATVNLLAVCGFGHIIIGLDGETVDDETKEGPPSRASE